MPDIDQIIARRKKALDERTAKSDDPRKDVEVRRLKKLLKRAQRKKLGAEKRRRLVEKRKKPQPAAGPTG